MVSTVLAAPNQKKPANPYIFFLVFLQIVVIDSFLLFPMKKMAKELQDAVQSIRVTSQLITFSFY